MNLTDLESAINKVLEQHALSLQDSRKIAEYVLRLSDFYIENPNAPTPWKEKYTQVAYLGYYLPLNFLRIQKIIESHIDHGFFNLTNTVYDFGSGLGAVQLCLHYVYQERGQKQKFDFTNIEISQEAQNLHQALLKNLNITQNNQWQKKIESKEVDRKSLLICSYSLTEQKSLPSAFKEVENILIIEPGTEVDGRKLLQLRDQLIQQGYSIWGPCTHQLACPLLSTKSDWCHDRVMTQNRPKFLIDIEKHMPIKNNSLTMSYLMASKTKAPDFYKSKARVTGDMLKEKGKSRIMVCRNQEREYLSWLKKESTAPDLKKGDLIEIIGGEKLGNEIRSTKLQTSFSKS